MVITHYNGVDNVMGLFTYCIRVVGNSKESSSQKYSHSWPQWSLGTLWLNRMDESRVKGSLGGGGLV